MEYISRRNRARARSAKSAAIKGTTVKSTTLKRDAAGRYRVELGGLDVFIEQKTNQAVKNSSRSKLPYLQAFASPLIEAEQLVKRGVQPWVVTRLASDLRLSQETLGKGLGISRATLGRKIKAHDHLDAPTGERVIGMARLIGQVVDMVQASGDPDLVADFDAAAWVGTWLEQPMPALGGRQPLDLMDTSLGQQLVSKLLYQSQSGAFA